MEGKDLCSELQIIWIDIFDDDGNLLRAITTTISHPCKHFHQEFTLTLHCIFAKPFIYCSSKILNDKFLSLLPFCYWSWCGCADENVVEYVWELC